MFLFIFHFFCTYPPTLFFTFSVFSIHIIGNSRYSLTSSVMNNAERNNHSKFLFYKIKCLSSICLSIIYLVESDISCYHVESYVNFKIKQISLYFKKLKNATFIDVWVIASRLFWARASPQSFLRHADASASGASGAGTYTSPREPNRKQSLCTLTKYMFSPISGNLEMYDTFIY